MADHPPNLPPPFGSTPSKKEEGSKTPTDPLRIGRSDVRPPGFGGSMEEGGMLVGPGHPAFHQRPPSSQQQQQQPPGFLPRGAVPPGARFDPITPIDPSGGAIPGWPSGEPDPDAEPLSGPPVDPLHPSWRPPRQGNNNGNPFSGGGGPPFFR